MQKRVSIDSRSIKCCVAHPCLGAGGSEATVLWALEGLIESSFDLNLISGCPIELNRLNRHCGTSVDTSDVSPIIAPQRLRRVIGRTDALRGAIFGRCLRSIVSDFDVCISGYNVMDFGKPAIQFIADFSFDDALRGQYDPSPPGAKRLAYRPGMLRRCYLGLARSIGGRSGYDGSMDWIVANSEWTAGVLSERLGMNCNRAIYPPVVGGAPDVPWERRAVGFAVLGRVSHEKRIDRVIDILGRVRAQGYDVHLHLIGSVGDDAYGRLVRDRLSANADWCFEEGAKVGAEKTALLAEHRYAIHGREGEAFGIAVAEQVKAGCIPFVPREGGPAEILGTDALTYVNDDEAVAKIVGVLEDPKRQQDLRSHLARRASLFSTERFMSEVRCLVDEWIARRV